MKTVNVTPRVSRAKCPIVFGVLVAVMMAAGSWAADRMGTARYDLKVEAGQF